MSFIQIDELKGFKLELKTPHLIAAVIIVAILGFTTRNPDVTNKPEPPPVEAPKTESHDPVPTPVVKTQERHQIHRAQTREQLDTTRTSTVRCDLSPARRDSTAAR